MLKPSTNIGRSLKSFQPPSGGCVLKHRARRQPPENQQPAAFGRLCVETKMMDYYFYLGLPAAFGRLCVETKMMDYYLYLGLPAAFGRLCVETK